ncbi:MAG: exosortase/archaeosortase family protein [Candidatus Sifarchaeia archaeon]
MTRVVESWNGFVAENRDLYFVGTIAVSSLIALAPFSREASLSDFFVYALLPIIVVFANRERFKDIPGPSGLGFLLGLSLLTGSFVFNWFTGFFTGDTRYGVTDYVILCLGIFVLFYSPMAQLVRVGAFSLGFVRAATLGLSMLYESAFDYVSDFFVTIVVFFSKVIVSPTIDVGSSPGQIIVGGQAENSMIYIGWACAGLEELVLISVILYSLIDSFNLSKSLTVIWLALGIAGSFVVNILRMVILVWVAYEYGTDDMRWVHTHLGDVLFLVWIGVFWVVFFKVAQPVRETDSTAQ